LHARKFERIAEFYVAPGYCEEKIYVYLATDLQASAQNLDDDEEIEIVRMPLASALERVRAGEINDAKSIVGLLSLTK
jgi:ADP-ribose pyrophosphatase